MIGGARGGEEEVIGRPVIVVARFLSVEVGVVMVFPLVGGKEETNWEGGEGSVLLEVGRVVSAWWNWVEVLVGVVGEAPLTLRLG